MTEVSQESSCATEKGQKSKLVDTRRGDFGGGNHQKREIVVWQV
jgi:hypothetical protein